MPYHVMQIASKSGPSAASGVRGLPCGGRAEHYWCDGDCAGRISRPGAFLGHASTQVDQASSGSSDRDEAESMLFPDERWRSIDLLILVQVPMIDNRHLSSSTWSSHVGAHTPLVQTPLLGPTVACGPLTVDSILPLNYLPWNFDAHCRADGTATLNCDHAATTRACWCTCLGGRPRRLGATQAGSGTTNRADPMPSGKGNKLGEELPSRRPLPSDDFSLSQGNQVLRSQSQFPDIYGVVVFTH